MPQEKQEGKSPLVRLADLSPDKISQIEELIKEYECIRRVTPPTRAHYLRTVIGQCDFSIYGNDANVVRKSVEYFCDYCESPIIEDIFIEHYETLIDLTILNELKDAGYLTDHLFWKLFRRKQMNQRALIFAEKGPFKTRKDWEYFIERKCENHPDFELILKFIKRNKLSRNRITHVIGRIEELQERGAVEFPEGILNTAEELKKVISQIPPNETGEIIDWEDFFEGLGIYDKKEIVQLVDALAQAAIQHICSYKPRNGPAASMGSMQEH